MAQPLPIRPEAVETWVFDLDNTLYPASCNLFDQIDRRIHDFIRTLLGLDPDAAHSLKRHYFLEYGSSMRGLMIHHGLDPVGFLAYVHDIDLSPVPPSPALDRALARLPGRKVIFTNGSTAHADRVLGRLGITEHFTAIFDIVAADYLPKPAPATYRALVERTGIDPTRAVFVEDLTRNLAPAAALGMTTVWVSGGEAADDAPDPAEADHVHHVAEDLVVWLEHLTAERATPAR